MRTGNEIRKQRSCEYGHLVVLNLGQFA